MKRLPISIQDFTELRQNDCIFIDKTKLIYDITQTGKAFFLSRPRRFGKSMTVSVLKELYQGNKAIFEGLWIYDKWDWSKKHPVIHVPFANLGYKAAGLETVLLELVNETAKQYEVELNCKDYDRAFDELIKKLSAKHGRVVILIDEYDKPIIDNLETPNRPQAQENRAKLREFYRCIKDNDVNIELFFMTGVSRFSQTGIFSHLNHLHDLTIDKNFNSIVGITQEELEFSFADRIEDTWTKSFNHISKDAFLGLIKEWYNGYSWDAKTTVYNPFSILNFFSKGDFQEYWFQSGSPKFLIDLLKERREFDFSNIKTTSAMIGSYEIENLNLRALLFQTGYLTIKEIDHLRALYTLDYPNREVEQTFNNAVLEIMTGRDSGQVLAPILQMENAFLKNDLETVVKIIKAMLRDIPSILLRKKQEDFYHALIHLYFRYLGWFIESEQHTSDGRMDVVVKTPSHVYILEFKLNESADDAILQIKNKKYADKYLLDNKEIIAVGVSFDTKKRTVKEWKSETIKNK